MKRVEKFKPTTLSERMRFVWMWRAGFSARAISLKCGTSITTVCRWIKRWSTEGHVNSRFREVKLRQSYSIGVQKNVSKITSSLTHKCWDFPYQVCNCLFISGTKCYYHNRGQNDNVKLVSVSSLPETWSSCNCSNNE